MRVNDASSVRRKRGETNRKLKEKMTVKTIESMQKNFCFLLCINGYTSGKVPSISISLQKDPIEGQRCVLSEEKKGKIKGKSKEKTTGKTIELTQKTSVFCSL